MSIKRSLVTAFTSAISFIPLAWSQTPITDGIKETSLVVSGDGWNQHPFAIYDSMISAYRYYWSCGGGSYDGICEAELTPSGTVSNQTKVVAGNSTLCDIQDPGVVKFNGTFYLYAGGVRTAAECSNESNNNEHAAIYGWSSTDGVHFQALNSENPVIQFAVDTSNGVANAGGIPNPCFSCYSGHGINGPTPVIMQACNCIRIYYWYQAPGYGLGSPQAIEAQDSTDGTNFSNERFIFSQGAYWQQVKRSGLYDGDYPLVMTFTNGAAEFTTAISSGFTDTVWECEYSPTCAQGHTVQNTVNTDNGKLVYPPHLESDVTGLLLDTNLNPFTVASLNNGNYAYLDWDNGVIGSDSFIYKGYTPGLNLFPDLNKDPVSWINEFIPSSYPNNTGVTQTFYVQGEDYKGGSAITDLQAFLSISSNLTNLTGSCHVYYAASNNTLYLDSSSGNFSWVGSQPAGGLWSGSNSNGVCAVNSWSKTVGGDYLTLTINLTFQPGGPWYEFASATNATGSSPWLANGLAWHY